MHRQGESRREPARKRRVAPACALLAGLALAGCDAFLDVTNPNNIQQEDLEKVQAAAALANGAYGTVTGGILAMWGPYETATDEVFWIGSRDAWQQLDFGFIDNPRNEFTDDAFKAISAGRWMADEAIRLLEGFDKAGEPINKLDLARAYLYGALAYVTIGDQFDRYALSNRMEAGEVIAPEKMDFFYGQAIDYLNKGLAVVQAKQNRDLEVTMTAMLARAQYSLALWKKLNPAGTVPADPLVNDAQAVQAAQRALALAPNSGWEYRLTVDNTDVAIFGEASLAYNITRRKELQFGEDYVELAEKDKTKVLGIRLQDPIDKVPDPVIARRIAQFQAQGQLADYIVVTAAEMHLILAEAALAAGNQEQFRTHINTVRALNPELSPYTGQIAPLDILKYERRVHLYLMARRLSDLYRFGIKADLWLPTSPAATKPGTFFPITKVECDSNPNVGAC